jgi:N-acetylglutamate synthase-like GNAT family acetyltransferase
VERAYRGRGIGRELSRVFHEHARQQGVKGLYAVELEEEGDSRLSDFLCRERGYRILQERRHTVWEKATGKKWYAKLMVCDLEQEREMTKVTKITKCLKCPKVPKEENA